MTLDDVRFLQDHAQSDNTYLCVLIAHSSVGYLSMQWLPCGPQAYALYIYQD
jgi:hypothetical protein